MKILVHIIDSIFPPRKTDVLLRTVVASDIENKFLPQHIDTTLCLSEYHGSLIQALITENKYHKNKHATKQLSTLLQLWLNTQTTPVVLLPIPLSLKRHRERGYNQVTIVLEALKGDESIRIDSTSLKRSKHTIAQTTLGRKERLANLTGAFICDEEKVFSYEHCTLILVDDVFTTGATMAAAHAALAPHLHPSATLLCLALAH